VTNFTPFSALLGGAIIGTAASIMLLGNGRVAGISGIFSGLLKPTAGDLGWRVAFVGGLLLGGALLGLVAPDTIASSVNRGLPVTVLAGVLVGFGVRMGNGCTSGHGVCGLSRLSTRSLVAAISFLGVGMVTASAIQLLFGGAL
jgi:uncharacterized membrane protein YedE/YeeE